MTLSKNNLFIVFSEHGKELANVLQDEFKDISYTVLENQIIGMPMENKLDKLIKQLELSDYGIVLITKDDMKNKREIGFLIGILIGSLGIKRVAVIAPDRVKLKNITDYLKYYEPNRYDADNPNKRAALCCAIYNIKIFLKTLDKKKTINDYIILENKKELLRIALCNYAENEEKYSSFLGYFIKCFNCNYEYINQNNSEVVGATLFKRDLNLLRQIGASGVVRGNHIFRIEETENEIIKCYNNPDDIRLTKKKGVFYDEEVYEYIFYKCINRIYILTVHIKCSREIDDAFHMDYIINLEKNNAGYISILELFLRGGNIDCEYYEGINS